MQGRPQIYFDIYATTLVAECCPFSRSYRIAGPSSALSVAPLAGGEPWAKNMQFCVSSPGPSRAQYARE